MITARLGVVGAAGQAEVALFDPLPPLKEARQVPVLAEESFEVDGDGCGIHVDSLESEMDLLCSAEPLENGRKEAAIPDVVGAVQQATELEVDGEESYIFGSMWLFPPQSVQRYQLLFSEEVNLGAKSRLNELVELARDQGERDIGTLSRSEAG